MTGAGGMTCVGYAANMEGVGVPQGRQYRPGRRDYTHAAGEQNNSGHPQRQMEHSRAGRQAVSVTPRWSILGQVGRL
jgi:hypothetical protein